MELLWKSLLRMLGRPHSSMILMKSSTPARVQRMSHTAPTVLLPTFSASKLHSSVHEPTTPASAGEEAIQYT